MVLAAALMLATASVASADNAQRFRDEVLIHLDDAAIGAMARPGLSLPSSSELRGKFGDKFAKLGSAEQQRIGLRAKALSKAPAQLGKFLLHSLGPSVADIRSELDAKMPADMFAVPEDGGRPLLDKALLVDLVVRGAEQLSLDEVHDLAFELSGSSASPGHILRKTFGKLGPGYVKLGQLLGNRPDLLGDADREELAKLSDDAPQISFEDVKREITASLQANPTVGLMAKQQYLARGARSRFELIDAVFASIDPTPLGVGSLGQVHKATLHDGRIVVIKILKPGSGPRLRQNLAALQAIAEKDPNNEPLRALIEDVSKLTERETDLVQEREAMLRLGPKMAKLGIRVPKVFSHYSGNTVIVQEFVAGEKSTRAAFASDQDRRAVARRISGIATYNVLVTGEFHADLHEGNIFSTMSDGGRELTFLDWGMNAKISWPERRQLLKLVAGVGGKRTSLVLDAMAVTDDAKRTELAAALNKQFAKPLSRMKQTEQTILLLQRGGVRVPSAIVHAAKTLMLAEGVAQKIAPGFKSNDIDTFIIKTYLGTRLPSFVTEPSWEDEVSEREAAVLIDAERIAAYAALETALPQLQTRLLSELAGKGARNEDAIAKTRGKIAATMDEMKAHLLAESTWFQRLQVPMVLRRTLRRSRAEAINRMVESSARVRADSLLSTSSYRPFFVDDFESADDELTRLAQIDEFGANLEDLRSVFDHAMDAELTDILGSKELTDVASALLARYIGFDVEALAAGEASASDTTKLRSLLKKHRLGTIDIHGRPGTVRLKNTPRAVAELYEKTLSIESKNATTRADGHARQAADPGNISFGRGAHFKTLEGKSRTSAERLDKARASVAAAKARMKTRPSKVKPR